MLTPITLERFAPFQAPRLIDSCSAICSKVKAIFLKFLDSLSTCFQKITRLFFPLSGTKREHRVREGSQNILDRLQREANHAMQQMLKEQDNPKFKYVAAPQDWNGEPILELYAEKEQTMHGGYTFGVAHFQGVRSTMEDRHLSTTFDVSIAGNTYPVTIGGIFDGHAGAEAAIFVKENLQRIFEETLKEHNPNGLDEVGIWNAIKMTCVKLNEAFPDPTSGTTAAFVIFINDQLWAANVGDSRIMLDNGGEFIPLSQDAKPATPRFEKGIKHRGGRVIENRINGDLGVARAIGDHGVQGVSARPKIIMIPKKDLKPNWQILITCDGLPDVASTRQLLRPCHEQNAISQRDLALNLVYSAYMANSTDNLSAMVIRQ